MWAYRVCGVYRLATTCRWCMAAVRQHPVTQSLHRTCSPSHSTSLSPGTTSQTTTWYNYSLLPDSASSARSHVFLTFFIHVTFLCFNASLSFHVFYLFRNVVKCKVWICKNPTKNTLKILWEDASATVFIDFGLLRSPYCKISYLLADMLKFDNLHMMSVRR